MAEFSFLSTWRIAAPIERVWEEISRPDGYPEWWPYVAQATQVRPGDTDDIGAVYHMLWETALPYGFSFDATTTRSEHPHLLEFDSSGDLAGTGRWELSSEDGTTTVLYYWNVSLTIAWLSWIAPLGRPLFGWNHAVVMTAGAKGLAERLGAQLVHEQSYSASSTGVAGPLLTTAGLIALPLMAVRQVRRLLP